MGGSYVEPHESRQPFHGGLHRFFVFHTRFILVVIWPCGRTFPGISRGRRDYFGNETEPLRFGGIDPFIILHQRGQLLAICPGSLDIEIEYLLRVCTEIGGNLFEVLRTIGIGQRVLGDIRIMYQNLGVRISPPIFFGCGAEKHRSHRGALTFNRRTNLLTGCS